MSLFGDRQESVYAHYNHEIRKNMGAGARIAELEAEVGKLRSELESVRTQAPAPVSRSPFSWLKLNLSTK